MKRASDRAQVVALLMPLQERRVLTCVAFSHSEEQQKERHEPKRLKTQHVLASESSLGTIQIFMFTYFD